MKKLLSIFLFIAYSVAVAQNTDTQLTTQANVIRNETQPAANTPLRVGNMFRALIDNKKNDDDCYKSSGSSNVYTISIHTGVVNFNNDFGFMWKVNGGNTGAVTLNPNGLGAKSVRKNFNQTLVTGDLTTGQIYPVVYDVEAGWFQIMLPGSGGGGGGATNFTDLSDVPNSYAGHASKVVSVKADETGLEFTTASGTSEIEYDFDVISGTTHTINATTVGSTNKWFIYTNASGCTVTMDDDVDVGRSVVGQRGPTAGMVTFDDNGTSVLITASGDFDLEAVNRLASWTKQTSTDWHGVGELGPAAASALTDGEGTTANGSAADLGGAVTTARTFTGTGNWNWGSDGTPYDGFLNFKGLYTGGTGGFSSQVRTASTQHSIISQFGDNLSLSMRDGTSGAQRTAITLDGSSNGTLSVQANNRLSLQTFSDNVHLILDADDGIDLKLGSDATGDIYYRNSSGFLTRLGVGSNTNVLTLAGGVPTWAAPSGGGDALTANPLSQFAATTSAQLRGVISDELGTGALLFDGATPTSLVGTNITGIPYAALTGTAPFWNVTGTTTLTGANVIAGSSSNTFKMNFPLLGTTATDGAGIFLENTTAAALGAQQISPGIILGGYGWRTNATAESQATRFRLNVLPVQGTSVPSATFQLGYSLNGGAYSNVFTVGTGTTRMAVTGIGTTSSFTNSIFNDSGGVTLMELLDDGGLRWGNGGTRPLIYPSNGTTTISKTGVSLTFSASSGNTYNYLFVNTSSSPANVMGFRANPTNSSGSAGTYVRRSDVTINNTGTYSGIFAYDYFDPTVTSATGTDQNYIINTNANFKTVLGAASGNSTLDVDGSFAADITATSTDITLSILHHTVVVDASGAARTITLPAAASTTRRIYYIINDTGTNTVTVDANASEVIGSAGATTYVIPAVAGNAVQIQSNGTKWLILSTL